MRILGESKSPGRVASMDKSEYALHSGANLKLCHIPSRIAMMWPNAYIDDNLINAVLYIEISGISGICVLVCL